MTDVKSQALLVDVSKDVIYRNEGTAPTKTVEKNLPRKGKRDAPTTAPSEPRGGSAQRSGRGERRGGFQGNEQGECQKALSRQSLEYRILPSVIATLDQQTTAESPLTTAFARIATPIKHEVDEFKATTKAVEDEEDAADVVAVEIVMIVTLVALLSKKLYLILYTPHQDSLSVLLFSRLPPFFLSSFSKLSNPASDHTKQSDQSWGAPTGQGEWNDEVAGAAIASTDAAAEGATGGWDATAADTSGAGWDSGAAAIPDDADGVAPPNGSADVSKAATDNYGGGGGRKASNQYDDGPTEEENKNKSFADYQAELAEKKLSLAAPSAKARKPNEGSKVRKEWENAKPISKKDEDGDGGGFMAGLGKKKENVRVRDKKEKQTLDVDFGYVEPASNAPSGRGGDRGGRGRGRGRGDRGDFRGRGRGDRGDRGGYGGDRSGGGGGGGGDRPRRGGRNEGSAGVNVEDQSAFPSLGGA
ncbi:uncharacterized protein KY384_000893 [Bacidia gigantensis]|uniref:uncharacterized protein n=1 Tax=Bacidia gigantensis TaxID=2732470 RepID=UPI001D045680|nr:uncharacterized protein KY384_000893 [Bacidia gigantensis]KAG8534050.1 hypothetical protein KY384_000893 [Bacidia gigantensis]